MAILAAYNLNNWVLTTDNSWNGYTLTNTWWVTNVDWISGKGAFWQSTYANSDIRLWVSSDLWNTSTIVAISFWYSPTVTPTAWQAGFLIWYSTLQNMQRVSYRNDSVTWNQVWVNCNFLWDTNVNLNILWTLTIWKWYNIISYRNWVNWWFWIDWVIKSTSTNVSSDTNNLWFWIFEDWNRHFAAWPWKADEVRVYNHQPTIAEIKNQYAFYKWFI